MITSRGWWFLLFVLGLLAVAIWTGMSALLLICLTLLVWFLGALFYFALRIRLLANHLEIGRQVNDERGPVASLWADRTFTVHVELYCDVPLPTPYLRMTDRVPFGTNKIAGDLSCDGELQRGQMITTTWHLHCEAPGQVRFEGAQVQFSDLQGFFYHSRFVRSAKTYRVLPKLVDAEGNVPTVKRQNILPLAGPNRFRRPGSGGELLDLRDYIPGDPPKTIAWKASARRDRLITKVFESEVPLRCTFFVDVSRSVRAGSVGNNALTRLVDITSAMTQATAAFRDLPGLCLFDENSVQRILRPARTPRHVIQVMNVLADAASLSPMSPEIGVMSMMPLAYGFAEEVYPDLMDREVNYFPWWLPWWAPRSAATFRFAPKKCKSLWAWPFFQFGQLLHHLRLWLRQAIVGRLSGIERQRYRWRKKLAALLAVLHDLGPGGVEFLMQNDEKFVLHLQQFLADHNVPFSPPLIGPRGEYLFRAPGKVDVLTKVLVRSVARAKDNEMFVLLADLIELDDTLPELLRAVKVARARHHQVAVVCPWPPGVPVPPAEIDEAPPRLDFRLPRNANELRQFIESTTTDHLHVAYQKLRRTFGRIGVPVLCAAQKDSVKLVLDRLERLRQPIRGVR